MLEFAVGVGTGLGIGIISLIFVYMQLVELNLLIQELTQKVNERNESEE